MSSRILELFSLNGLEQLRAVASETRLKILMLLVNGDQNIHELARALDLSQPSITRHINVLEEAGLIRCELSPGTQGIQKRCHLSYDRLTLLLENNQSEETHVDEFEMPVGLYALAQATSPCGLANREGIIWIPDNSQAFFQPERATAQILWMSDGYLEYVFPNSLPAANRIQELAVVMEICSETENYNNDFPSDITMWINGVETGTWTAPGDMGGARGRLNPDWWHDYNTQYGFLKAWSVNSEGTSVDGDRVSDATLSDLRITPQQPITVRIGIKPDAKNRGGFNLFGRGFGNHEQDLVLRVRYSGGRVEMAKEGNGSYGKSTEHNKALFPSHDS